MKRSAAKTFLTVFLKTTFLILLCSRFANAQSGYVVFNSGDTLNCHFEYGKKNALMYNPLAGGTFKIVTVDSISSYYNRKNKCVFVAKYLPGKDTKSFIARSVDGKISVYQNVYRSSMAGAPIAGMPGSGFGAASASNIEIYLQKNNTDSVYYVRTSILLGKNAAKQRQEIFNNLLGDDKELLDFFLAKDEFTVEEVTNIIKLYNKRNPISKGS